MPLRQLVTRITLTAHSIADSCGHEHAQPRYCANRRNDDAFGTLGHMGERPGTREARRAVKRLVERYFLELKKRLGEQNEAFWAKITPKGTGPDDQARRTTEKL